MPNTKKKRKRKRKVAGDPITVGGGGGRRRRRRIARIPDSHIKFDRSVYKKKKPHEYESGNDVLLGVEISCAEEGPTIGPNSVIQIDFSDSRVPSSQERVSIVINGTPLGIKFTGDWVDKGSSKFYSSYLMIREVYVDDHLVVRSNDGDCTVCAYNRLVNR